MPYYIVNTRRQSNGDYEVHNTTEGCDYMPEPENQDDLGWHRDCDSAVKNAEEDYDQVNGCYFCSNECHTS